MPHFDKHFSLSEANVLLPHIREIFSQIFSLADQAKNETQSLPDISSITPGRTNGKMHSPTNRQQEILQEINRLLEEITEQGIVVQDISRGLIDFPSFVQGEEVFLCYELNDGDAIHFWHHLNAGYAGRTPLSPDD